MYAKLDAVYWDSVPLFATVKNGQLNLNIVVPAWLMISTWDDKILHLPLIPPKKCTKWCWTTVEFRLKRWQRLWEYEKNAFAMY